MKNILIYTNLYPNPIEPNRGCFVKPVVKHLGRNNKVTVISPVPWFPRFPFSERFKKYNIYTQIPECIQDGEINVYFPRYFIIPKMGAIHPIGLYLGTFGLIKKLHKMEPFDIINAHWLFPDGVVAAWIAKKLNLPVVLSARGCDVNHYMEMPLRHNQIVRALMNASGVTVVSEALGKKVEEYGISKEKIRFIPNGVNIHNFFPRDKVECRKKLAILKDAKVILFVGQIIPVKGITTLLEAVLMLKERAMHFKIVMIGNGQLLRDVDAFIEKHNLSGIFTLLGEIPQEELPDYLGASDVLCLPSIREGRPNVVIEAIASGRPVVASNVGGVPELVDDFTGILVPPQNPEALADSLIEALQRTWDAGSIRNQLKVGDWETSTKQYESFFTELLDKK